MSAISPSGARQADRTRLGVLEAKIERLEHSLSLLQVERLSIQERLEDYKYPVLTIPNAIVSEIFLHFPPEFPDCSPLTGIRSPTLLAHICRKWRQIAFTTPALWSAILFPSSDSTFENVRILEQWLARSSPCPLSLEINQDPLYAKEDVLQALLPHRSRWDCPISASTGACSISSEALLLFSAN